MIEPVVHFFEKLVTKFTWPRMIFTIVVFALTLAGVSFFELYTGHFRLARIETASNLLDKLISQSKTISPNEAEPIREIHAALVGDLRIYTTKQSQAPIPPWILKCLAAVSPWVLLSIFMLFIIKDSHRAVIGGIFVFSIPFVVIGALLPDLRPPWLNYVVYPILSCVCVVIPLVILGNRKTKFEAGGAMEARRK